jgi:hypothetical protein
MTDRSLEGRDAYSGHSRGKRASAGKTATSSTASVSGPEAKTEPPRLSSSTLIGIVSIGASLNAEPTLWFRLEGQHSAESLDWLAGLKRGVATISLQNSSEPLCGIVELIPFTDLKRDCMPKAMPVLSSRKKSLRQLSLDL